MTQGVLSSAPDVDDGMTPEEHAEMEKAAAYRAVGWQQNPDGSWYPATPEAIAAAGQMQTAEYANTSVFGGRARREAEFAAEIPSFSDLPAVDANEILASRGSESAMAMPANTGVSSVALSTARRKGQLSALVSIAQQRKAQAEQAIGQSHSSSAGRR